VQALEINGSTKFGDRIASVADASGNVHVAYLQTFYSGTSALLRYISWNRARGAWDAPTSTTTGGSVDLETPAIAVQNGVTVAVAFGRTFQNSSGTWSQKVYFAQSSTGWKDELVSSALAQNTPRPSLVESNGEFHVAYLVPNSTYALDGTGYWRRRVQGAWQPQEAFSTSTTLPTADTSSLGATRLFVDSLGGVNVFYSPYSNSTVQWSRRVPGWTPYWTASSTTAPPGKWSSAKKADVPALLWVSSYGNMRYSTWSNGQWADEEVPNTSPAFSPSLAIDALGQPHISYNNTYLRQLIYVTKRAGTWVSSVVDTGLDVNDPCSLTLVEGKPHIAYQRGYSLKGAYLP
jgi:hypothetical protein